MGSNTMDDDLLQMARETIGFMPPDEGLALYEAALTAPPGYWIEIGSYCGKSTIYLGAAARARRSLLVTIDHHRGSEEHQVGEGFHDPRVATGEGTIDTLPHLARNLRVAGLGDVVLPIAGLSETLGESLRVQPTFTFIDGGHSLAAAQSDLSVWGSRLHVGGVLAIHDVFEDPAEGGRPPFEIYRKATASGAFEAMKATGSLRILKKTAPYG